MESEAAAAASGHTVGAVEGGADIAAAAAHFVLAGVCVGGIAVLPLPHHLVQGGAVFLIGGVGLGRPAEVTVGLVQPAPGVADTALEEVPLGIALGGRDALNQFFGLVHTARIDQPADVGKLGGAVLPAGGVGTVLFDVYLVFPFCNDSIPAFLIDHGVGKSGSPTLKEITSSIVAAISKNLRIPEGLISVTVLFNILP